MAAQLVNVTFALYKALQHQRFCLLLSALSHMTNVLESLAEKLMRLILVQNSSREEEQIARRHTAARAFLQRSPHKQSGSL